MQPSAIGAVCSICVTAMLFEFAIPPYKVVAVARPSETSAAVSTIKSTVTAPYSERKKQDRHLGNILSTLSQLCHNFGIAASPVNRVRMSALHKPCIVTGTVYKLKQNVEN